MLGIRLTFAHVGTSVPASGEVLAQTVRRAAQRLEVPVEHLWVGAEGYRSYAVVFVMMNVVADALTAGVDIGRCVESEMPTMRFTDCGSLTP
jgi:hypothetical protein